MKIAITGHSRGLGAELHKVFTKTGHEVLGFSRTNGYDLRDWSVMQKMLDIVETNNCSMFINLAKPDFVQTTVLYQLWNRWRGQSRTIINIGSVVVEIPTMPKDLFDDSYMDLYRTAKVSLQVASQQLLFKSPRPWIIMANPVHLYGDPITEHEQQKLSNWTATFVQCVDLVEKNGFNLQHITF